MAVAQSAFINSECTTFLEPSWTEETNFDEWTIHTNKRSKKKASVAKNLRRDRSRSNPRRPKDTLNRKTKASKCENSERQLKLLCRLHIPFSALTSLFPEFISKHVINDLTEELAIAGAKTRSHVTNATFFCKDDLNNLFAIRDENSNELYIASEEKVNYMKVIMHSKLKPRVRHSCNVIVFNNNHLHNDYDVEDVVSLVSNLDSETKENLPFVTNYSDFAFLTKKHQSLFRQKTSSKRIRKHPVPLAQVLI